MLATVLFQLSPNLVVLLLQVFQLNLVVPHNFPLLLHHHVNLCHKVALVGYPTLLGSVKGTLGMVGEGEGSFLILYCVPLISGVHRTAEMDQRYLEVMGELQVLEE